MAKYPTNINVIIFILFILISYQLINILSEDTSKDITITQLQKPPKIDGVLDDECWAMIKPVSGFYQYDPQNGKPASEETLVWAGYDDKNIYFAFQMMDSCPDKIYGELTPRNEYSNNDSITVYLDTYFDKRTYFAFELNPLGIQADSVETIWVGNARRNEKGWAAEMAIPFKSLRFPKVTTQVWGVNFLRYVHRLKERDLWTDVKRDENFLQKGGILRGIEGINKGHNLEFFPYVGGRYSRWEQNTDKKIAGGIDVKYGLATNLILDLTASPDYSEVESDPFIYQLTPHEILLSEKRPFFAEGSQYFTSANFKLFYSRRITDPRIAVKFTGKSSGFSFGIINADNKTPAGDQLFSVFRVKKDILKDSWLGLYYTEIQGCGVNNQNVGFDCSFRLRDIYIIQGQWALTRNHGDENKGNQMGYFSFQRQPDAGYSYVINYYRIGENANPKTGYVYTNDIQGLNIVPGFGWRFKKGKIKRVAMGLEFDYNSDCSNETNFKGVTLFSSLNFRDNSSLFAFVGCNKTKYQVYQGDHLVWSEQFYPYNNIGIQYQYDSGKMIKGYSFSWQYAQEGLYQDNYSKIIEGRTFNLNGSLTFRPRVNMEVDCTVGYISQRAEYTHKIVFSGTTLATALHYQLTKGWYVFTQYQGDTHYKQYNYELLLGYNFGAGKLFQFIYKKQDLLTSISEKGFSLTAKFSYLLRM